MNPFVPEPRQHLITRFFAGRMLFLSLNQDHWRQNNIQYRTNLYIIQRPRSQGIGDLLTRRKSGAEILKKNSFVCLFNQRIAAVVTIRSNARVNCRQASAFIAFTFVTAATTVEITGTRILQCVVSSLVCSFAR